MFRIETVDKEFIETKEMKNSLEFDINITLRTDVFEQLYLKGEDLSVQNSFGNTLEFKNNRYIARSSIKEKHDIHFNNHTAATINLFLIMKK